MKPRKEYETNGLIGCVEQRKCRKTGLLVGLYQSAQAGMEDDPEQPWSTVCEEHGNLVCHATLTLARQALSHPEWCEDCQAIMDGPDGDAGPDE